MEDQSEREVSEGDVQSEREASDDEDQTDRRVSEEGEESEEEDQKRVEKEEEVQKYSSDSNQEERYTRRKKRSPKRKMQKVIRTRKNEKCVRVKEPKKEVKTEKEERDEKYFKCLRDTKTIWQHIYMSTSNGVLVCNLCGECHMEMVDMKIHVVTHHLNTGEYTCEYCANNFRESWELETHHDEFCLGISRDNRIYETCGGIF
jgi:hypothetical protein